VWKTDEIPAQIIGVLFGSVVSAVITMLLLSAQTSSEEEHEVSGKIFDKKTDEYLKVLEYLEKIISDGKVDTIRDNRLDSKDDEFSRLLFGLTRLSSFVERKKDNGGMNKLISAVTEIIKTTTAEDTMIPRSDVKEFWDGKGKKSPNQTQNDYYTKLAESLKKISDFAAENIQRGSFDEKGQNDFDLKKLIKESGLFPEKEKLENKSLGANNGETEKTEENLDYRINCIAKCLGEMKSQLKVEFGNDVSVERYGNAGDDYYWGRWTDENTSPETIADWLLAKPRRNEIGFIVKWEDGYKAEFCLFGDGKSFASYIFAPENLLEKADSKREEIDEKFGAAGWWIPGNFVDAGWIIGGSYGGDFNGVNLSFDFRNSSNMSKSEYEAAYQKFKENAIQGIISGRGDSIKNAKEELKALLDK
ncbi:MAG: hypothetical protein J6X11_13685, partial [Treponema sp.]|nr:hypothetical protein [Treponema sp.]